MKKMTKGALGVALVLITLVIVLFAGTGFLIKTTGASIASNALGVPVSIDSVSVSYLNQSISFEGLEIGSPEGYEAPYMLRFSSVDIDAESLFGSPMIIDTIKIGEYEANFETGKKGSNFQALQKGKSKKSSDESSDSDEPFEIVVGLLEIEKGKLKSVMAMEGQKPNTMEIDVPGIKMKNLGSKEKPTTAEVVIGDLMNKMTRTVMNVNPAKLFKNSADSAKGLLKGVDEKIGNALGNLLGN